MTAAPTEVPRVAVSTLREAAKARAEKLGKPVYVIVKIARARQGTAPRGKLLDYGKFIPRGWRIRACAEPANWPAIQARIARDALDRENVHPPRARAARQG